MKRCSFESRLACSRWLSSLSSPPAVPRPPHRRHRSPRSSRHRKLARYEPDTGSWREWRLPGSAPQPYAVYVDEDDIVWVTDFGANALVRFDSRVERFRAFPFPSGGAEVRQLLGRLDEIWSAESGTDKIVVLHTG